MAATVRRISTVQGVLARRRGRGRGAGRRSVSRWEVVPSQRKVLTPPDPETAMESDLCGFGTATQDLHSVCGSQVLQELEWNQNCADSAEVYLEEVVVKHDVSSVQQQQQQAQDFVSHHTNFEVPPEGFGYVMEPQPPPCVILLNVPCVSGALHPARELDALPPLMTCRPPAWTPCCLCPCHQSGAHSHAQPSPLSVPVNLESTSVESALGTMPAEPQSRSEVHEG